MCKSNLIEKNPSVLTLIWASYLASCLAVVLGFSVFSHLQNFSFTFVLWVCELFLLLSFCDSNNILL